MKKLERAQQHAWEQVSDPATQDRVSSLRTKLLLSVSETAELLGISSRTVFLLLASGDLKRRKLRRRTVIHRDDILRFAAGIGNGREDERV
jgi:excisionase family DNA binding protein